MYLCPVLDLPRYRWSYLHITDLRKVLGNKGVLDEDIAYFAGLMEAMLTAPLIRMHWENTMGGYCASPSDYCNKLQDFISNSVTWMNTLSGWWSVWCYSTMIWGKN